MRRWLLALAVALALAGAARAWLGRWSDNLKEGIDNFSLFRVYGDRLAEFHQNNGRYPASLSEVGPGFSFYSIRFGEDRWGHPLRYESRGSEYVLVSLGRDGKPDGLDPWRVREAIDPGHPQRICNDLNADQVMSDRGFHR